MLALFDFVSLALNVFCDTASSNILSGFLCDFGKEVDDDMFHQRYIKERKARNDNYPPHSNNTALYGQEILSTKKYNVGLWRFCVCCCCYDSSMGRAPLCGRAFKATVRLGWLVLLLHYNSVGLCQSGNSI